MRFVLIALLIWNCSKSPDEYAAMAAEELKRENADAAFSLLNQAYEASLPEEMFWLGRKARFNALALSQDGRIAVAVKALDYRAAFVWSDLEEEDEKEVTIEGTITNFSLSPTGRYTIFLIKAGNSCTLRAWDSRSGFTGPRLAASCDQRPAISDAADSIYFLAGEDEKTRRLHYVNFADGSEKSPYMNKFPDKPYKKLPAVAHFYYSREGIPFFTYGVAGTYKLYNLTKDLNVLSKDLASPAVYFTREGGEPVVITGGAGNYKMVMLHPVKKNSVLHTFGSKEWQGIAVHSTERYFYTDPDGLVMVSAGTESHPPFWVSSIHTDYKGQLRFLSVRGTPMVWDNTLPAEKSLLYYRKGLELEKK